MICFLIYMNTVTDTISQTTPSLFVDDLSLIGSKHKPSKLCKSIQQDLDQIHKWSINNQMVFAPEKFNIINIGHNRLTPKHRQSITYGNKPLTWTKKAKLLGVTFDIHLNFLQHMKNSLNKLKNSQWRIYQHSNHIHGSNTHTLLEILDYYILPSLAYGSSLWIFQAFPEIRLDKTPMRPYGETFNEIQRITNNLLSE